MHEVHSGNARISRPLNRRAPGDRKRTWNNYPSCPRHPRIATLSQRRQAHNDTSAAAIVCKIAQFTQEPILGASTAVAWPLAERLKAGVRLRSSQLGAEAGDCRLESKA